MSHPATPLSDPRLPQIVFEDNHLLVVNKPAGLLSQGDETHDESVVSWAQKYLGRPYVGLVHRLDRNTSGLMVLGKRTKSAQRLSESIQKRDFKKTYLACVEGILQGSQQLSHYLRKDEREKKTRVVTAQVRGAQLAKLSYKALKTFTLPISKATGTLVEIDLETGRFHQIRAQMGALKHPLLGDFKYGAQHQEVLRVLLHSAKIEFPHPVLEETMVFRSDLPPDMAHFGA